VLALTVKTKEKEFILELVTLAPLLLLFKKVKSLNIKILYSLFLFRGKVFKVKEEDLESDRSTSLKDVFITSFL